MKGEKMKEELLQDLKEAMKNKELVKKDTITMLRAAILQVEKDTQKELSDSDICTIVAKEVKKRKESIEDYIKGGREDIVNQLEEEINVLSKYLPEQLTNQEIEALVKEAIENTKATSPREMGKVMQYLRPKIAGKADGKIVSDIVKNSLNNI